MNKRTIYIKFRNEALSKRTKAELWAQEYLVKLFVLDKDFTIEHIFDNRRFDFYFKSRKIALEIDGGYHNTPEQRQKDFDSDLRFKQQFNLKVLRVKNFDQLALEKAVKEISYARHFYNKAPKQEKNVNRIKSKQKKKVKQQQVPNRNKKKQRRQTADRELLKRAREDAKIRLREQGYPPVFILRRKPTVERMAHYDLAAKLNANALKK